MIYLVLAVIFLHIISLPIVVGVKLFIDTDGNIGKIVVRVFAVPVFVKKLRTDGLIKRSIGDSDEPGAEQEEKSAAAPNAFLRIFAFKLLGLIRVRDVALTARIGTGDAALDGMAVGGVRIMYTQACAFFGSDGGTVSIEPRYGSEVIFFDFFGIFSLCFADIIFAVCCAVLKLFTRTGKRRSYANVA